MLLSSHAVIVMIALCIIIGKDVIFFVAEDVHLCTAIFNGLIAYNKTSCFDFSFCAFE